MDTFSRTRDVGLSNTHHSICRTTSSISEGPEICSAEQFGAVDVRLRGELARYLTKYPKDPRSVPVETRRLPAAIRTQLEVAAESFRERIVGGVANQTKQLRSPPNDEVAYEARIDANYVVSRTAVRSIQLPSSNGGASTVGYLFDCTVRDETGANSKSYRECTAFSARSSASGIILDFLTNT